MSENNDNQCTGNLRWTLEQGRLEEVPGAITSRPIYYDFAILDQRTRSFWNWPSNHPVNRDKLADAGFFYSGCKDITICFYCGKQFSNWQAMCDPWIEHTRFSPKCGFIEIHLGPSFIQTVQDLIKNMGSARRETHMNEASMNQADELELPSVQETGAGAAVDDVCNASVADDDVCHASVADDDGVVCNTSDVGGAVAADDDDDTDTTEKESIEEERHKILEMENYGLRQKFLCKICLIEKCNFVFLPCGHVAACKNCSQNQIHCPICRKIIVASFPVYM